MKSKMEKSKILAFLLNEYSCLYIMTLLIDNFFFMKLNIKKSPFLHQAFFNRKYTQKPVVFNITMDITKKIKDNFQNTQN